MENEKEELKIETLMLNKSIEAFLMSIEIYNKPTIKYRLEGFSFFICNAWELLLKAKMLKDGKNIYYEDKPNRTISLNKCLDNIFTNEKDYIRKNLEIIINLRNTATHYIIKELDLIYLPFMQANVLNYSQKLYDFFNVDITEKISSSFLTLVANQEQVNDEKILSTYGNNIFNHYIKIKNETQNIINESQNDKLAIKVDMNIKIVKDTDKAQATFRIAKDGEEPIKIIKEIKDVNLIYCYTQKRVREIVVDRLKRKNISIKFTQYELNLLCDKYNLKDDEKYYYYHQLTSRWGCSQQLIDFIVNLFTSNPNILDDIKNEFKTNHYNKKD